MRIMQRNVQQINEMLRPVVTAMGYELVGVELRTGRPALLRVYIDRVSGDPAAGDPAAGITVDDCERVSHQVGGLLDVEQPISGDYTLEVSSPGLDRPLFEADHYRRFIGERVRLKLALPLDGRRKFSGLLRGLDDAEQVMLDTPQGEVAIPLAQIESARLIPDFDRLGVGKGQG